MQNHSADSHYDNFLLPPHHALLLTREERQWEIGWSVRNEIAWPLSFTFAMT